MPKKTLNKFSLDMRKLAKELPLSATKAVNEYAVAHVRNLTALTPVDTSKALSNWRISQNKPSGDIEAHVPGFRGSTKEASREITIADASHDLERRKPFKKFYLSNLTPYIEELDSDHPTDKGFVRRAMSFSEDKFEFNLEKK